MKVPCIICLKRVETKDKKVVATLCKECSTPENIKELGQNFNKMQLKEVLKRVK